MDDEEKFQSEALIVSRKFQNIRDEVVLQYGYDRFKNPTAATAMGNSTQQQFSAKTMMQCDSVVDEGVQRCADWFSLRWAKCMEAIPVPVVNHVLCVSMKFHFLCGVLRVMTPWCREQIPVEENFGQLFDQLNSSVHLLSKEFSTQLLLQEQQEQEVLSGPVLDEEFTKAVRGNLQNLNRMMEQLLEVLQLLLSFSFITIITQAFSYLRQYRRDVCFDNFYITTYFRQIDTRRMRAGKRHLLPLNQSEKKKLVDPWSPRLHPEELRQMTSGVFQVFSVALLSLVLLSIDFSLHHVLDIISRHTFIQLNLTSHHQVDIRVGGDSMMARLLRKTVSAFNSSSVLDIRADNQVCVSSPSSLPAGVYISCVFCVLLVALFSCLQVYTNRLRRAIAAFFHPKREKSRTLFLYNLQLQRRISCPDRKRIITSGQSSRTVLDRLCSLGRGLCGGPEQEESDREETHQDPC
ncbi:E3 ubiquitin-protein ligase DCST1 [Xyrichtys novacula]|nr:E3 ubiquitin-protein ligase DCST1 [Xyrichtys novacula]